MSKKILFNDFSSHKKQFAGYSLIELIVALTLTLIILGVAIGAFTQALSMRSSEGSRTDALTSVQAAINILSREISNSGYGLKTNGIVVGDSDNKRLHFRANTTNTYPSNSDPGTVNPGEDITYFYDVNSKSVVRYDAVTGVTSGVINRVSDVEFHYYDYSASTVSGPNDIPTSSTGRVEINLTVFMPDVKGQPSGQTVTFRSDVTLRNSPYMLSQY